MLRLKAPQGVCHSHQLLYWRSGTKINLICFLSSISRWKQKDIYSKRIAKSPQNINNNLIFTAMWLKHHRDMKEEKLLFTGYFVFFVNSREYTPSVFLKCRGMGWGLVVAGMPKNWLLPPVASRRQCCSVNKSCLIPAPELQWALLTT